ncbi:SUKH-4 family immunity protein [Metabacillus fastidiosus]|uniref:SUKH-4 family immunity protein n=1 Tax=Metabacillus fastidiosus TaxID=1458 RepID=UPI002E2000AA|nr:SUKH-4 family immunity protein [Metabacillus fastidiosus]
MEINKLNLPIDTKKFLLTNKFKENEFDCLNVDFFSSSDGFLLNVAEWTIKNDFSLSTLGSEYKEQFLASLEKFKTYLVIGENANTGNLITIHQPTGEIYELEHEITETVEKYFVNSSIEEMYYCLGCFKKYWIQIIEEKQDNNLRGIFNELKDKLMEFDSRILINDDDYNRQFWNSLYFDKLNFFLEKLKE